MITYLKIILNSGLIINSLSIIIIKMSIKTFKILIHGKVQGVFFRSFIKEKAGYLNIKGFTRNIENGSVEVVAQGNEENIGKFIEFFKIGPKTAKVERIEVSHETMETEFKKFEIK